MIKPSQIPLEVRNAVSAARKNGASSAEIAAAALNAWPRGYSLAENDSAEIRGVAAIILPLPQEVVPKRKKTAPKRRPVAGREGNIEKVNAK